MNAGETIQLSGLTLVPEDIIRLDFGSHWNGKAAVQIVFREMPGPEFSVLDNEISTIREFARVNNLVGNEDVKYGT